MFCVRRGVGTSVQERLSRGERGSGRPGGTGRGVCVDRLVSVVRRPTTVPGPYVLLQTPRPSLRTGTRFLHGTSLY